VSPLVVIAALVAGAVGALARYGVTRAIASGRPPRVIPWAVLIVNVIGSLLAGCLFAAAGDLQYVVLGGFAGGLTTFSTWTVETVQEVMAGRIASAVLSIAANLVLGIAAAFAGYQLIALLL
jgi:CrcB protein